MGVLSCDRTGCANIMCDNLSYRYGYICNECKCELSKLSPSTDIEEFMLTTKEYLSYDELEEMERRINNEFVKINLN